MMLKQARPMEFAQQAIHAQQQKKHQKQHLKIKQEPMPQQILTANQTSPNGMLSAMNPNSTMSITSPQMLADGSSIDSNVNKVTMKAMMAQGMINASNQSNQVNQLNTNMIISGQVMNATMSQNSIINVVGGGHVNTDLNRMEIACGNELMHQKQQLMRNKAMHLAGARPPPPEYKNNVIAMMGNQRIPQNNEQFPPAIRHMQNNMHYK